MTSSSKVDENKLSEIIDSINDVFQYDPYFIFTDSFDRINIQLKNIEKLIHSTLSDQSNYWFAYNIVINVLQISEKIIFAGYSDQILNFLLDINYIVSETLIFCTSRFIPFRIQILSTVCSAFANSESQRDKDADSFINNFKNELITLRQLESTNMNGLNEEITLCTGKKSQLSDVFQLAFTAIHFLAVHFNTSEEIPFEKVGAQVKPRRKTTRQSKEEPPPQVMPLPQQSTIQLILNAFNNPLSKTEYLSKYSQAAQAWTNPECQLAPSFLYRLIFSFLKCGNVLDGYDNLEKAFPDDRIIQLAVAISKENWIEVSNIMEKLSDEEISADFQFFNIIADKIWKRFCAGQISDPLALKGVLHVLLISPAPCPIQTSLIALHYCWYLDSRQDHKEAADILSSAIKVIEDFRDIFSVRCSAHEIPESSKIPNRHLEKSFIKFGRWIQCLHTDLITVWIRSKLKYGLYVDTKEAEVSFEKEIADLKQKRSKAKELYGKLSLKQKAEFDRSINRKFKPPIHSARTEKELLNFFKSNNYGKAILYMQMAFFRPKIASALLEKARKCLSEVDKNSPLINSSIAYFNRTEIGFLYPFSKHGAIKVAIYGKEVLGSSGLTLSNTSLNGTGIKQDPSDIFIVSELKQNTMYSFGFGAFNSRDELINNISEPFSVITCHPLSVELIYSYLASTAFHVKDLTTFDVALSYLLDEFVEVRKIDEDHAFYDHLNPFNRFLLKKTIFKCPPPIIRSFSTSMVMAARLFSNKPMHATAFQKIAVILSQILQSFDLTLQICHEIYSTLQPLLVNPYNERWIIHPLLFILNALKHNTKTAKEELHQALVSKCSYALEGLIIQYYQEKQLSSYIVKTTIELSPNQYRTKFLLFASKQQILETNVNDSTLPLSAADLFRVSPERSFDDLFNKFKSDSQLLPSSVFIISAAHNIGLCNQAVVWSNNALEYSRAILKDLDERQSSKKGNSRGGNKNKQQKKQPQKNRKDASKPNLEDEIEMMAATKIQTIWNRYHRRNVNIGKFREINKWRAALNLLLAMSLIETDKQLSNLNSQETSRAGTGRREKLLSKGRTSKHSNYKKTASADDSSTANSHILTVITALKRAIVLANRVQDIIVMRSAASLFKMYLENVEPGTEASTSLSNYLSDFSSVLVQNLPLEEQISQELIRDIFVLMMYDGQNKNVLVNFITACKLSRATCQLLWILPTKEIPNEISDVYSSLQRRDPAINQYYEADSIYQRALRCSLYQDDDIISNKDSLIQGINEVAISLQHKQKISMSICLFSKLSFLLLDQKENAIALSKLCEALECHFRTVKVQDKIDQILKDETTETFYQKHSWSGCISIFVIASLVSIYSDKRHAMQLCRLASFSLSSLFCGYPNNPKKQIDYITYEPSEIIPGVDMFTQCDSQNPLLEPVPPKFLSIAINHLLSSMLSYEMYFEMFKPLAFARHFYRFIVREKKSLARIRLMTVITCTHFGLLEKGLHVLNDVITCYGDPRATKESPLYFNVAKRMNFESSEQMNSSTNTETLQYIASSSTITQIFQNYGFSIMAYYAICISKIMQNIADCSNKNDITISEVVISKQKEISNRNRNRRSQSQLHRKEHDFPQLSGNDAFDSAIKMADFVINDVLSRESRPEYGMIITELQLEKALILEYQWKWSEAINQAKTVIQLATSNSTEFLLDTPYINRPILLPNGITKTASTIIARSAYNLQDFNSIQAASTPLIKSLLYIHKAEYERAVQLLAKIALNPPITIFHKEYILCVAQLISLFCYDHKLYENVVITLNQNDKSIIEPVHLITKLTESTFNFFETQLGINESRSYYIKNTQILVRLKHLEAVVSVSFNGNSDPLELLKVAQSILENKCPYISHGLEFLLDATLSRIQMQKLLLQSPTIIQEWNRNSNLNKSQELIDQMIARINVLFSRAPDCVVHPLSQQSILDLVVLIGNSNNEKQQKLEHTISTLVAASTVRSSRRFIQSLVSQTPETPPLPGTCPVLLLNENKDLKQREIAAAYYSHVCSLDLPFFDTEILELRTYFYYKFFEEKCSRFKSLLTDFDSSSIEDGHISGQWYQVNPKIFKVFNNKLGAEKPNNIHRPSTALSKVPILKPSRPGTASNQKKYSNQMQIKGSLYFFMGLTIEVEESLKKKVSPTPTKTSTVSSPNIQASPSDGMKITPIIIVSQATELNSISNEMAEIGSYLNEAIRMETSEVQGDVSFQQKEMNDSNDPKKRRTRQTPKTKNSSQDMIQSIPILKNQAEIATKNAETKWKLNLQNVESIFNKSNKIMKTIHGQSDKIQARVKFNDVEISNAASLSHFFNIRYGINEKSQQFALWLYNFNESQNQ